MVASCLVCVTLIGLGSSPGWGDSVVFLAKTLHPHSASLTPVNNCVQANLSGGSHGRDQHPIQEGEGDRNTSSHFIVTETGIIVGPKGAT